jgi:[ribosomal protein S5]-alanine N-acetyltransferase
MEHRLPVLMGRRLLLREPTPADATRIFEHTTDPEVTQFLAFDPPRSPSDTLEFIGRCEQLRQQDREYTFAIAEIATDLPCGMIGLRHIDLRLGTAQIGTWLRRDDWSTGLNREAKALLLDFAFGPLALYRIEARIALENHRSRRAFEKLGGVMEGTLRQSFRKDGVFHDQALYAILAPEWSARGGGAAILGRDTAESSSHG